MTASTYRVDPLVNACAQWAQRKGIRPYQYSVVRVGDHAHVSDCRFDMVDLAAVVTAGAAGYQTHAEAVSRCPICEPAPVVKVLAGHGIGGLRADAMRRVSDGFLQRLVVRDGHVWKAAALAELKRRELEAARELYFSRSVKTTLMPAYELKPGYVITSERGAVRMVVRDTYWLAQSRRMLVTFSCVNLVTGEVEDTIRELPLMAQTDACRVVSAKLPDFSSLATDSS